jgi:hypothetical protein
MKKGDKIITVTSVKIDGKLHFPGAEFEVGKNIGVKEAKRFFDHDAVKRHFEEDISGSDETEMSVEEMANLDDISGLKVQELKKVCEFLEIEGFASLNKPDLIAKIEDARSPDEDELGLKELDEDGLRMLAKEELIDLPDDADIDVIRSIIASHLE